MPKKPGQKPNGLPKKPGPKEGPAWKHVMVSALSERCQALYDKYAQKIKDAKVVGQELHEAVTAEWNTKFPDGIDGKVCAFRVANGDLTYVMKRIPKKKKARKADQERGDDVFRNPLDGLSETRANSDVSKSAVDRMFEGIEEELGDAPVAPVSITQTFTRGPRRFIRHVKK